jgi:hypothetical protein
MKRLEGGKNFNMHNDKTMPKNKDSCFGDFPIDARVKPA